MAKNSIDAYGASGKTNVLMFEPENLHLVTDKTHPLYDERIHLPINEAMVLNIMDQGVLEPIIVWKDPETGKSCVVDGRQRVRHTLEANKRLAKRVKLRCWFRRSLNVVLPFVWLRRWSANEIRQADTPLGRAKKWLMRWSVGTTRRTFP
jgi:ParB family chromosome partitioning protein